MSNSSLQQHGNVFPALWPHADPLRIEVEHAALSDKGKIRSSNEDHFLVARFDRTLQLLHTNVSAAVLPPSVNKTGYAMIVADGVGGINAGDIASKEAITTLVECVLNTPDWIMSFQGGYLDEVNQRLNQRLQKIVEYFNQSARADKTLSGMATTLTLAASLGDDLLIAHIGDSRAYLFSNGQLQQLTRDHTVSESMKDAGNLSSTAIRTHLQRDVLTGLITTEGVTRAMDFRRIKLKDGDQVLICTDGLTDMIPDDLIAKTLQENISVDQACQHLLNLAMAASGTDNITAVLCRYRISGV